MKSAANYQTFKLTQIKDALMEALMAGLAMKTKDVINFTLTEIVIQTINAALNQVGMMKTNLAGNHPIRQQVIMMKPVEHGPEEFY